MNIIIYNIIMYMKRHKICVRYRDMLICMLCNIKTMIYVYDVIRLIYCATHAHCPYDVVASRSMVIVVEPLFY